MNKKPGIIKFHTNIGSTPKQMLKSLGTILMSLQNEESIRTFHASKANQTVFVVIMFDPEIDVRKLLAD